MSGKAMGCPVQGCADRVRLNQLMCNKHWDGVPEDKAAAVYREGRRCNWRQTDLALVRAQVAAIDAVKPSPGGSYHRLLKLLESGLVKSAAPSS